MYWNANGIFNHHSTFKHFLTEHQIDAALINETHLKPYHKFKLRNYDIIRNDRPDLKGGTTIIIKSHLPHEIPSLQTIEATGITLCTQHSSIELITVYKQPKIPLPAAEINKLYNLNSRRPHCKHSYVELTNQKPKWHRTSNSPHEYQSYCNSTSWTNALPIHRRLT